MTTQTQADTSKTLEQELADKGLTAPKVSKELITEQIAAIHYFTAAEGVQGATGVNVSKHSPLQRVTYCVLTLKNGWTSTGMSSCVSPENFNAETGKRIAYDNAFDSLWPLFGFNLRNELHKAQVAADLNTVTEGCYEGEGCYTPPEAEAN